MKKARVSGEFAGIVRICRHGDGGGGSRAHRSRRHAHGRSAAIAAAWRWTSLRRPRRAEKCGRLHRIAHRARPGAGADGIAAGGGVGTKGVERHAITFHGQEAHSGSTPMNVRRDALAACAKLALEIRSIAGKHADAVCTMGSVKTFPGIVTAVVGRCEATLDQRDLDAECWRRCCARRAKPANGSRGRALHGGMVAHLADRADRV